MWGCGSPYTTIHLNTLHLFLAVPVTHLWKSRRRRGGAGGGRLVRLWGAHSAGGWRENGERRERKRAGGRLCAWEIAYALSVTHFFSQCRTRPSSTGAAAARSARCPRVDIGGLRGGEARESGAGCFAVNCELTGLARR